MDENFFRPCQEFPWYLVCRDGYLVNSDTGVILRGGKNGTGYRHVTLLDAEGMPHSRQMHRLVALAFCEQKPGATEVNHINGDKMDSRAENLEWVTHGENLAHAFDTGLMPNNATPKPVVAVSIDTGELMEFPSIYKAARFLGISQGNICMACKGERPYAGGYYWRYAD